MAQLKKYAHLTAAAVMLTSGTVLQGSAAPRLVVECEGKQQAALCSALKQALSSEFPNHDLYTTFDPSDQPGLTIRYVGKNQASNWLSGHLIWKLADGRAGNGPIIEYSVMDRQLNADDMTPFAQQLVRSTQFPNQ